MTAKQILDSFSETLMRDERILSAQERALLVNLLHHARTATAENQETHKAVRSVIASAVGETVAHRAFAVLGSRIVERILEDSPLSQNDSANGRTVDGFTEQAAKKDRESPGSPMGDPMSPSPEPQSPGVRAPRKAPMGDPMSPSPEPQSPGVKAPRKPAEDPMGDPMSPSPEPQSPGVRAPRKSPPSPMGDPAPEPQSPGHDLDTNSVVAQSSVAVAERPSVRKAQCVILDEFLAPQEVAELLHFTLANEKNFAASEVVSPREEHGIVNYEHRRSRVLMGLEHHEARLLARIESVLPQVLGKLGMEEFPIASFEAQITASNDGDFFRFHSDNGSDRVASRYLTFVYFFHQEPRPFEGGELRIHDARLEDGVYVSDGTYQTIVPQQNQIVLFPCELLHEITPVKCPSGRFADSRFTLNGWFRR